MHFFMSKMLNFSVTVLFYSIFHRKRKKMAYDWFTVIMGLSFAHFHAFHEARSKIQNFPVLLAKIKYHEKSNFFRW